MGEDALKDLQRLPVVLCLYLDQLLRDTASGQFYTTADPIGCSIRDACLPSESSLHSLFLWPQNCTCLQTADPVGGRGGGGRMSKQKQDFRNLSSLSHRPEMSARYGCETVIEFNPVCIMSVPSLCLETVRLDCVWIYDSPCRSPSDWPPPPFLHGERRPWPRPAAGC